MVEGGRYGHEEKAHHRARNRFWEARVARILRICNLLHKSNGEGSHGSVEVYLDLFLGSSSPYSYTIGSLTLPPDVPAHTCATIHHIYTSWFIHVYTFIIYDWFIIGLSWFIHPSF